jgi:hypothetical protein
MKYYIQYNPTTGIISSMVSSLNPPSVQNQIELDAPIDITKKKVNVSTLQIIDKSDDLTAEEIVKIAVMEASDFGKELIVDFAVKNVLRNYTTSNIATVANELSSIFLLLQSGALYTAKEAINNFTPTALVTADDKSEFIGKINEYLGI